MTIKIKLKLTLSPDELNELIPVLQRMERARAQFEKLASVPAKELLKGVTRAYGVELEDLPPFVEHSEAPATRSPGAVVTCERCRTTHRENERHACVIPDPGSLAPTSPAAFAPPAAPTAPAATQSAGDTPLPPPPGPENDDGDETPGADVSGVLDSDGLPWDARIHSSSRKTLKKTGAWKPLRGVSAETVAAVTAELRARGTAPAGAPVPFAPSAAVWVNPAPAAPAAPTAPAATQTAPVAPPPPAPTAPAATQTAPVAPPPPAPVSSGPCETFPDLIKRVTVAKITNDALNQALKIEGVESLVTLAATPEKIPAVARRLGI